MFGKVLAFIGTRAIPGIVTGPAIAAPVVTAAGRTITAFFVPVISLRETNPALGPVTTYLTLTRENERFLVERFDNVVGLDVSEDGTMLTLRDLEAQRAKDIMARQAVNAAAGPVAAPVEIALDQILGEGDPA